MRKYRLPALLSFPTVHSFDTGYVRKQPVSWKEYCTECWSKQVQESMDRCTCHRYITEMILKMALNTVQSTNLPFSMAFADVYLPAAIK